MTREWLMTGFGLGYLPRASGTFGSAGAILIAFGLGWTLNWAGASPVYFHLLMLVLAALAVWGCAHWGPWAIEFFRGKYRKPVDPGAVVLDEFAGQWIALVAMPLWYSLQWAVVVMAVQFLFFRIFDVLKVPPARQCERLSAGWGILLDDLAAGVYANMIGQIIFRLALGGQP